MTRNRKRNTGNSQKVTDGKKQHSVSQNQLMSEEKSLFELFNSVVKYIEENLKAITWLATIAVAIVAALLKFIWYALDAGKMSYWKIDYLAISNMNENTLYNIFLTLSFSAVALFFLLIPYTVLKLKWRRKRKIICFVVLYIGVAAVFFVGLKAWIMIENFACIGLLAYLFVVSICYVFYLMPSLFFYLCGCLDKKRRLPGKKLTVASMVFAVAIWIAGFSTYAYWMGFFAESFRSEFRVVDEKYAIVHETDRYYYMAELEAGNVHRDAQKIVEKGSVEYTWQKVNKVR